MFKGLQVAHQHAGETKSREIWEYLFRRLNTRPKEGLNGEGWLVGELSYESSFSYALESSQFYYSYNTVNKEAFLKFA